MKTRCLIISLLIFAAMGFIIHSAYAETLIMLVPMDNGRPPIVSGEYNWSCLGRADSGQKDALVQIETSDQKVIDELKALKGVIVLTKDAKTGELYTDDLKVLTAASVARVDTKPVKYEVALKVVEVAPVEKEIIIEK